MAYKIFTGAKTFLKAHIKPFGITEIEMLKYLTPWEFYSINKN